MTLLKELITQLIRRFLHQFIDLSEKAFDWDEGDLKLENVMINKDALKLLALPLRLKSGWVGKLTIKMNVMALTTEPVRVSLEDVFIIAGPVHEFDAKTLRERNHHSKAQDLRNAEMAEAVENETELDDEQSDGAGGGASKRSKSLFDTGRVIGSAIEGLKQQVLDNLQVPRGATTPAPDTAGCTASLALL